MQLVLVSGLSGSGKSIALNVLEDSGYYCIDNLPVKLLQESVQLLRDAGNTRVAMSIDARSGGSLGLIPGYLDDLKAQGVEVRPLFLEAKDGALIRRFSETRRHHPLAQGNITLEECLARERDLLSPIAEISHRIDTSELQPNALRSWIRDLLHVAPGNALLLFESFAYKQGVPLDADLVFDVRCLPNPFYVAQLRPMTGLDSEVAAFLEREPQVSKMLADIGEFVETWLPAYRGDNRGYLTVAIGCTGGRHRSVYFAERLAARFRPYAAVVVRHRNLAT
ncbi:MAG: RNase adaptor protein RapZ [Betaproteobacteria bacterium RIFCSPLOWO2_02_FULL_63_19]|nr:MAG: RNase adaptor protein RapZ [Betaproteobacteria bacterium RIFCSPLOWO2_02_FULL_63_19]